MKITTIIGSPRRANTYSICKIIEQNIRAKASIDFEYIFLGEENIENCRGCLLCFSKGEQHCPIKDNLPAIWDKIDNADAVIFAAPVYVLQVPGIIKNFFDRSAFKMHRPSLVNFNQPALIVTTTGISGLKEVAKYLGHILKWLGFYTIDTIGIKMVNFENNDSYKKYILDKIEKISLEFLNKIKAKQRPTPSIYDLMFFAIMKKMFTKEIDNLKYNKAYWKKNGWLEKDYFVEVPINPIKKIIAKVLLKLKK